MVAMADADGTVTMLEDEGYHDDADYVRETYFK